MSCGYARIYARNGYESRGDISSAADKFQQMLVATTVGESVRKFRRQEKLKYTMDDVIEEVSGNDELKVERH